MGADRMAKTPHRDDVALDSPTGGPSSQATAVDRAAAAPEPAAPAADLSSAAAAGAAAATPQVATPPAPTSPMPSGLRRRLRSTAGRAMSSALVFVVLGTAVAYSADFFGLRERIQPLPRPAAPIAHGATANGGQPVLASNPYWQTVTTLQGDAAGANPTMTIADGALQWRVSWTCRQAGHLLVQAGGAQQKPLVDGGCPGTGTAFSAQTGRVALAVTASGPWQLKVEQQIDTPVADPPLPAMTAPGAVAVSTGSFYAIDFEGSGKVTLYRLADSSYALRLDNFYVTPNSSLDIRFSAPAAPHSDSDVADSAVAPVADLVATAGSMNFLVPAGVDPTRYGSVAVWCVTLRTAYAAASLGPPR